MTAVELDPIFVKALKLLHSRAKDSGAQLKSMLDDAIAHRKGLKVPSHNDFGKSSPGRSKSDDDTKKKESEKRSSDKTSKDGSEPDAKKMKIESKSKSREEKEARDKEKEKMKRERERKEKEERDAQKQKEKLEKEKREKELSSKQDTEVNMVSDEEEPSTQVDAGDFAFEMGIACVVCRQFDVSSGNQLVECQECHSLYHQECHKPPVTEEDVSDPRFVWYCSRCTKSLKKMVTQKPIKPKLSSSSNNGKELPGSASKLNKNDNSSTNSQAFRRIDPKAIVAPKESSNLSNPTSKPMVGLEGLAANLAKPRGESKSGSSRKSEQKDGSKSSSKTDGKSSSGNKSDSSSKSSSSSKGEEKKSESKSSNKEDKKGEESKSSNKEDRKNDENKSSNKEDRKNDDSKSSNKEDRKNDDSKSSNKEDRKGDESKSSNKEDRKGEVKSSKKSEEKKYVELKPVPTASSTASSTVKEEKKSDSKGDQKSELGKSPSHSGLAKLDVSLAKTSPPHSGNPAMPVTPDSPSSSKSSSNASNKQAIANLSMVTANKRIQMMKKKAQTKPEKKIHIK
ncbi:integrator complex subunit 12-like [Physella acuta]|uniref:integrator complex subunit 12-like n=1 Tax=Physella acuta TaxID=109671 RepID=UPI0027DC1E8F|nr:integrator complex subunit 12-like [Physella acuta]XP_059140971.1 integrator complex subunit 12-like [Physella acuta]